MKTCTNFFDCGSRRPMRLLPSEQLGDQDAVVFNPAHQATSFEGGPVLDVAFALVQCASRWNVLQEQRGRRQLTAGLEAHWVSMAAPTALGAAREYEVCASAQCERALTCEKSCSEG